jgi:hypothetical protein
VLVGERPLAGHLHEIVGKLAGAAERDRKPPEVRQEGDELVLDASSRHCVFKSIALESLR